MPLYSFACGGCGARDDSFALIAGRDGVQTCRVCASPMSRVLTAPHVAPDYPGYNCPVSGAWIEGRKAHTENLKRTGSRLLEPGETREFIRRRAQSDDSFAERIAETAAATVAAMPAAKQEKLASELSSGADVSFVRTTA